MYNIHGGNLDAIEREYGIPKDKIRDFSGNVNPLGPPKAVLDAITQNVGLITRYPDVSYLKLRESIGRYTGVSPEHIIIGNGSTELISLFIKTQKPKKAVVVAPAYSEYESALKQAGSEILLYPLNPENSFRVELIELEKLLDNSVQLLVMCNPNNPTGTAMTTAELARLLEHTLALGIKVMVDETYAEFADEAVISTSLVSKSPNLFTIRGTSKFFAVPGLRLGYGMCSSPEILERIYEHKDPWSVNILSAAAGEVMFDDAEYIAQTYNLIKSQREFFYAELSKIPKLQYFTSQSNFILVKAEKPIAAPLTEVLLKKNMLVRNAGSFPFLDERYFRFCMLMPEDNAELIREIIRFLD